MSTPKTITEEQLFDQLISSIVHSVWVALGKTKSPITNKLEKNLPQASVNIDMLDMLYKRMDGNLSEKEETYVSHLLHELKMNYLKEQKNESTADQNDETSSAGAQHNKTTDKKDSNS